MGRTLLLNASFEPLCVVSIRRAVVLVLKEKAEVVARNGAELRSERTTVPVPSVIRLDALRTGSASQSRAAVAPRGVRPRRWPLSVLHARGREHRPRVAAVAGRAPHVGERGGLVPLVQRPQGGSPPRRGRSPPPPPAPAPPTPASGSSPPPARSTRLGRIRTRSRRLTLPSRSRRCAPGRSGQPRRWATHPPLTRALPLASPPSAPAGFCAQPTRGLGPNGRTRRVRSGKGSLDGGGLRP